MDATVGIWETISDLARRQGVTKGPVSRRVARLEEMGELTTRVGARNEKLVNVAEFLRAVGKTEDVVRATNGAPKPAPSDDPAYSVQQARKTGIQADLHQLELDERLGKLVEVGEVESAMQRCAGAMVRAIEQLPAQAEDLASAVARDGVQGARKFLKEAARGLRDRVAAEMRLLPAPDLETDDA